MLIGICASYTGQADVEVGPPLGLDEVFQAAMKRSEDVAIQEELIVQAEARFAQAASALYPSVNGFFNWLNQPVASNPTGNSFSPSNQTTLRITADQPLFRGLREFAALRLQKASIEAGKYDKQKATIQLYQDVVASYYQVLTFEQDVRNLQHEIELNVKRLAELERFRKIGRSRPSEVLSFQANLATLESQIESVQGQVENARAVFTFLTGLDLQTRIKDSEPLPEGKVQVDKFISKVEDRPDVKSLAKAVVVNEQNVSIARGAHLPSADLIGNYYFARPGLLTGVNWDIQLQITMPIFQGGLIQSQVTQAASMQKQSELALSKQRRLAQQEIERFYASYHSDMQQYERQKRAVSLSMKNYEAESHDYRLGLVTNLEVLQALTAYQGNQRALDRIQFQMKADFLRLQAAAAIRPTLASVSEGE
jgi:outer membrane protein